MHIHYLGDRSPDRAIVSRSPGEICAELTIRNPTLAYFLDALEGRGEALMGRPI
jgi:hypothetical protein